jgi:hypothetical protein
MMRSLILSSALLSTVVVQTAPLPPTYDATFVVADGQAYKGTMTFRVDRQGAVTGRLNLTQPLGVTGTLAGAVKDGTWTFEYPYAIAEKNCTGVVKGTGKVPADKQSICGTVVISGVCSATPQKGTFTMSKQPP